MGRIEEALRRVAAERDPEPPAHRFQSELETPFSSPWQFDRPADPGVTAPRLIAKVGGSEPRESPRPNVPVEPPIMARPAPARSVSVETVSSSGSSVRLESQLALSWPQPFASDVTDKLVVMRGTHPAAVQQYRRLSSALEHLQLQRGVKVVMIASAVAAEGRTLTAANLALTLTDASRRKVLLIDAAFRQPRLHRLFQVSAGSGLSYALRSPGAQKLPLIELTGGLSLLPAGRPESAQDGLLGSARMREILKEASEVFEWVIVDSGPVTVEPEAGLLAPLVDASVLVIDAGRTPQALVERAVEILGRDRLAGVVLNRADESATAAAAGT